MSAVRLQMSYSVDVCFVIAHISCLTFCLHAGIRHIQYSIC